ncbi:MAG: hypothetical protein HYS09_00350 [Chloroflexi bacterium]|nr:hypothetical protein [Chloroflexota bacterium]
MADYLDCSTEDMARLAFCRRPVTDAATFRREVEQIAAYASVRAERLAQLLREIESIDALQAADRSTSSGQGFLMAARDRVGEEKDTAKDAGKKRRPRKDKGRGHKS